MKVFIFSFAFACISFSTTDLHAQSGESIILIDGVPTEVILGGNGEIQQIVRSLPNYMSEYDKSGMHTNAVTYDLKTDDGQVIHQSSKDVYRIIYFKSGHATMSDATLEKLDKIAEKALENNDFVFLNTSYSNTMKSCSEVLTKNRVNACKRYLELRGVPASNIFKSIGVSEKGSAKIEVFVNREIRP